MNKNRTWLPIAVLTTLLLVPAAARAAEIYYLPGVDRSGAEKLGLDPSVALLTWELPGGLLAVDRVGERDPVPGGRHIAPIYPAGEWFLVDARARRLGAAPAHRTLDRLEEFGAVHRLGGDFALCEIPTERLPAFLAARFDLQRIPTDPPPAGWQRYAERVSAAVGRRDVRADPGYVAAFVALFDEAAFQQVLREMSGAAAFVHDGGSHKASTRYYDSADKNLVGDYLFDKLVGYGYTVEFDDFIYNGTPCRNLVATKTGVTSPDEYVVLGAHYDSTSEQPTVLAPGAEDNGSGSSLVLELARMAAPLEFDRSVQFVLFDAEEVGIHGSQHFVDEAVAAGRTIVSAIALDMVCFYDTNYGVIIEGETPWEWLMTVMEDAVADYTALSSRKDYFSWGSDHVPFQQAGIPAFLAIDWDWSSYPHYHESTDDWVNLAPTAHIGNEITQACAATLAEVAGLRSCLDCAPPPIPDGSLGTSPMRASRIDAVGTRIEVGWDDRCAPASTKIVYGPLSDVSTWTITDAVCSIDNPEAWDSVPAGDLWFLLVAGNAAGAESSWGQATAGERNGMTASNTCGSAEKDVSATCP